LVFARRCVPGLLDRPGFGRRRRQRVHPSVALLVGRLPLGQWRHAAVFHRIVARGTSVARDRAPQLPMPHRRADRAEPYPSAGPSTVVRRFHAPASTGTVTAHIPERPRPWTWADR